jgi:hypothetical protein
VNVDSKQAGGLTPVLVYDIYDMMYDINILIYCSWVAIRWQWSVTCAKISGNQVYMWGETIHKTIQNHRTQNKEQNLQNKKTNKQTNKFKKYNN